MQHNQQFDEYDASKSPLTAIHSITKIML